MPRWPFPSLLSSPAAPPPSSSSSPTTPPAQAASSSSTSPPPPLPSTDSSLPSTSQIETETLSQSLLWTTFPPSPTSGGWTLDLGLSPPARLRVLSTPTGSPLSAEFSHIRHQPSSSDASGSSNSNHNGSPITPFGQLQQQQHSLQNNRNRRRARSSSQGGNSSSISSNSNSHYTFGATDSGSRVGQSRVGRSGSGSQFETGATGEGEAVRSPSSYASFDEDMRRREDSWGSPVPASLSTKASGFLGRGSESNRGRELDDDEQEHMVEDSFVGSPERDGRKRSKRRSTSGGASEELSASVGGASRGSTDEGSLVYKVAESLLLASRHSSHSPSKKSDSDTGASPNSSRLYRSPSASAGLSFSRTRPRRRPRSLSITSLSSLGIHPYHQRSPSSPAATGLLHQPKTPKIDVEEDDSDNEPFHSTSSSPPLPLYYIATTQKARDELPQTQYLVEPSSRAAIAWTSSTSSRYTRSPPPPIHIIKDSPTQAEEEDPTTPTTNKRVRFLSGVSLKSIVLTSPPLSPTHLVSFPPTTTSTNQSRDLLNPFGYSTDSIVTFDFVGGEERVEIPLPVAPINSKLLPTPGWPYSNQSVLPPRSARGRKRKNIWGVVPSGIVDWMRRIPVSGWLFILGFLFPPCWWYGAFIHPLPSSKTTTTSLPLSEKRPTSPVPKPNPSYGPMSAWPDNREGSRVPEFVMGGGGGCDDGLVVQRGESKKVNWREGQQSFLRWKQKCKVMSFLSIVEIGVIVGVGIWAGTSSTS